jgi:cation diffusion facilitator family transporter
MRRPPAHGASSARRSCRCSQRACWHRRTENLAALGEASILAGGGIVVVVEALKRLFGGGGAVDTHWYVFAVIGAALVIDISRIAVSVRSAARYRSAALRSNAFHFAGDMAGSLAVLAGLLAVAGGFEQGDATASLVVALIIFGAAGRLVLENGRVLMDTTPAEAQAAATAAIAALGDDVELRRLRVRESGGHYFADAVVGVAPGQAVVEGHGVADEVEAAVRQALPDSDVVVHLEPRRDGLDLRDRALAVALREPLVREAHDIVIYEHDGAVSVSLHLKFPRDTPLAEAHRVAERIERELRAEPGVEDVRTHLEPLEQPLAARADADAGADDASDAEQVARIGAIVTERTGQRPRGVRLLHTGRGLVVFVSVAAGSGLDLPAAHDLAGRLEDDVRKHQPGIADVVVHTEP